MHLLVSANIASGRLGLRVIRQDRSIEQCSERERRRQKGCR
jgi:hypothetical protein